DVINKGCPIVLGGPLPHVMAAKAIAFKEANTVAFQQYAAQIVTNAKALAEALLKRGAHLTTGGTDNHLLVVDVATSFGLTGRQAEEALTKAGITLNRNAIPFDKNGAWFTSGIRIGTAAVTTLGMKEKEMEEIADCIYTLLKNTAPATSEEAGVLSRSKVVIENQILEKIKRRGQDLLTSFSLYPELLID
ncbi:MAG: glycine hydroxymethyltransferase, partial [Verrucomicrobia bacterium]|nr:glycine hydroxymethyltransferase [Verrucomicrobiota bacterium]